MTWGQCFILFLAIWVCTNRQESFYYIYPKRFVQKNERHSRLINIHHFFAFYSSGIHLYSITAIFSNYRFFYHHRAVKYLAQQILLIKFPTGGKNLPTMINICKCGWKHAPGAHKIAFYPKSHSVKKCPTMPENPISNLITLLTLLAVFISWHFSLSLYFDGAIAYLDISRHSFPYLHTLRRVVCQSESSMKSQSELRISYSRVG